MTKRLTEAEKARRAFYRSPTGQRLRKPSKRETARRLADLKTQGEAYIARGQRLAAAYALDDERMREEHLHHARYGKRRWWFRLGARVRGYNPTTESVARPWPMLGATLAQKIAARTEAFYEDTNRPPTDGPGPYVRPRKWWEFWRPRFLEFVTSDEVSYGSKRPRR